jgi:hypothetical protein
MLVSLLILTVSVALLIYWFRYCCLALLRSHTEQPEFVPENRFSFVEVRAQLQSSAVDLDPLHQSLDRDYRVVTYLLQHAAGFGTPSVEQRILRIDYKLMQAWYWLTRTAAPEQARKALWERATILGFLAQKMGQQAGVRVQA